ncbi:MAG: sulfatase [Armatimonadota bacterium]|nr:sulfatase [Armatimonadota bacterium]
MTNSRQNSYTRRSFLTDLGVSAATLAIAPQVFAKETSPSRPNVLLITVDDMNWDSLGVTGCKVPDISPNIDALAAQGLRFEQAHVTCAVCQPSRSAIMTGRYPHRSGAMGFEAIKDDVPTLTESLRAAGYMNGIMAKVPHLAPQEKFCWDTVIEAKKLADGRGPKLYYQHSKAFFEKAKAAGKPFFLMANSQDPHRPFPNSDQETAYMEAGIPIPKKVDRHYKPEEAEVPGFLPDNLPDVKTELAQYYTAVHRCDQSVGEVLRALKETGMEDNTIVVFLSDNGMSFPYSKTNCYDFSTKTPMIVRWPGKVKPGSVNHDDFVSGIDFMPTVLEAAGLPKVKGMDGNSFVPLLKGKKQNGRDHVFTFFSLTSGRGSYPMRCLRNKKYSYIYNDWSDGQTIFRNEPQAGLTFKAMQAAAETDPAIAERVNFFLYRVTEEFYNVEADPYEKKNLINDPKYKAEIGKMRAEMLRMMVSTKDPILESFKKKTGVSAPNP